MKVLPVITPFLLISAYILVNNYLSSVPPKIQNSTSPEVKSSISSPTAPFEPDASPVVLKTATNISNSPSNQDPIVNCNSKTGTKQVPLSVCKSFVDCPNGSGGFIFESKQSCDNRWKQYGSDLEKAAKDLGSAITEQQRLNGGYYINSNLPSPANYSDIGLNIPGNLTQQVAPLPCPSPVTTSTGEVVYTPPCPQP